GELEAFGVKALDELNVKAAVEELGLKEGDKVEAVIKATEVLVSKD
ncbi:MAG TPA: molybdenum-pterin-binding protein, partial [Methanophagales archaeon]|nr:molybdenum-pterin-binding protein [Methanophagales archaeon]